MPANDNICRKVSKLSKDFVAYRTMVNILAALKSLYWKSLYWKSLFALMFWLKFYFDIFNSERYEDFK